MPISDAELARQLQEQEDRAFASAIGQGSVAASSNHYRNLPRAPSLRLVRTASGSVTADPHELEMQRRIEAQIHQQNIERNLQYAFEHNPEAFARVTMLYVDMKVNGMAVKAFVDSGAQTSVMSLQFAQRCGLGRLIDSRFSGVARGVGAARIVGRVHAVELQVGRAVLDSSITIIDDNNLDFLFGLDMLLKHKCVIDLERMELRVAGHSIKFLPEKDLPLSVRADDADYARHS